MCFKCLWPNVNFMQEASMSNQTLQPTEKEQITQDGLISVSPSHFLLIPPLQTSAVTPSWKHFLLLNYQFLTISVNAT